MSEAEEEIYEDEPGTCGYCGEEELIQQSDLKLEDGRVYWKVECGNCGADGREYYDLVNGVTRVKQDDVI